MRKKTLRKLTFYMACFLSLMIISSFCLAVQAEAPINELSVTQWNPLEYIPINRVVEIVLELLTFSV